MEQVREGAVGRLLIAILREIHPEGLSADQYDEISALAHLAEIILRENTKHPLDQQPGNGHNKTLETIRGVLADRRDHVEHRIQKTINNDELRGRKEVLDETIDMIDGAIEL